MTKNTKITLGVVVTAVVLVVGMILLTSYFNDLPNRISQHETIVLGQSKLVPGSQAGLRVVVRDSKDGAPLKGAEITVSMKPTDGGKVIEVYHGTTDGQGSSDVNFTVPDSDDL